VNAYRVGWLAVALPLGAFGLGAAAVLLPTGLVTLVALFAVAGVLVATLLAPSSPGAAPPGANRRILRAGVLSGLAGGALAGLVALAGPAGAVPVALVLMASPPALRSCRRALGAISRPSDDQLYTLARSLAYMSPGYLPFELAPDLRMLSDDQLDRAWRESRPALLTDAGRRELLHAVEERGRYLDELERRQPGLLKAWLAAETGEPGEPLSRARAPGRPTIDWDQLTGGQATDR
jgi:hypothetical protein